MGLELRVNGETVKKYENPVKRVTVSTKLGAKTTFPVSPEEGIIDISVDTRGSGDLLTASDEAAFNALVANKRREQGVAGISHVANPGTTIQDATPITAVRTEKARREVGDELENTKEDRYNPDESGSNQTDTRPGAQFDGTATFEGENPEEEEAPNDPDQQEAEASQEEPTEENTDPNNSDDPANSLNL